jgi:hypothetical protein
MLSTMFISPRVIEELSLLHEVRGFGISQTYEGCVKTMM